jgi:RimJ/RimL family protein N-acetyltransferase
MEKITIRPYKAEDADDLYEAARESVTDLFPWMPWCHPDYSRAEAEAWARSRAQLFSEGREYDFAIVDSAGRFLGGCGLNQISREHWFANLGYWVRTSAAGHGTAPAATRRLAAFAFAETNLLRLEIVCAVENRRSQRVAEKAGAIREGILHDRLFLHGQSHDAVIYALVKSNRESI